MNQSKEENFKLLMIDDEEGIVFAFQSVFKNFKQVDFFIADNASRGLELARTHKPQVVTLDLRMPGMNGEEALIELKKILPDAKFIVMTGWGELQTQKRIEEIGVEAYYQKPIDLEKIMTKLMSLLMVKNRS